MYSSSKRGAMTPFLEMKDIVKRFPGVVANDHINLTIEEGEIHALLGENGAGKSTLMQILYGLYQRDSGEILVRGQPVDIQSPSDAIALGIGMIHQDFMLDNTYNGGFFQFMYNNSIPAIVRKPSNGHTVILRTIDGAIAPLYSVADL